VFDQGSQISDTVSQNPIVLTEETPIDDSTRKKHKKKKHKKRKFGIVDPSFKGALIST